MSQAVPPLPGAGATQEEGLRLAKRVAAEQACSRRQAEALIAAGAVQVAGQTVTDPARRVRPEQPVQVLVRPAPSHAHAGGTVVLHKPAGVPAAQALHTAWAGLDAGPLPQRGLRECWPLPASASGLSVWSDAPAVLRRLADQERPLEVEWLLGLPAESAAAAVLQAQGVRLSLSHEREGWRHWRVVGKGRMAAELPFSLDVGQFPEAQWRCQRLGRLGLAPLVPGEARWLRAAEKF